MPSEGGRIKRIRELNRTLVLVAITLLIIAGIVLEIRDPGFWVSMAELLSQAASGLMILP